LGTIGDVWCRITTTDYCEWSRPLSRVLVLLTTMLLLVMPVTEHLCNWDKFLRGGPDVEFSLLAGLLFAAMVVLSMNGTMLQPRMLQISTLQPGRIEPVPAARARSEGADGGSVARARNMTAQPTPSLHLLSRSNEEPASAFDSCNGPGFSLPLRI
jgi:hypothetical protein